MNKRLKQCSVCGRPLADHTRRELADCEAERIGKLGKPRRPRRGKPGLRDQ